MVGPHDIGRAVEQGRSVHRKGWNGKGQHLRLQSPDRDSLMVLPCIFIMTVQGDGSGLMRP